MRYSCRGPISPKCRCGDKPEVPVQCRAVALVTVLTQRCLHKPARAPGQAPPQTFETLQPAQKAAARTHSV